MTEEIQEKLRQYFPELTEQEAHELARAARFRSYDKGEWIFSEGMPAGAVHWLESGSVELLKGTLNGKSMILHVMEPEHFIDACTLFGKGDAFYSAMALQSCRVIQIEAAAMLATLGGNAGFSLRIMRGLAARQRMFINKIAASQGKISVRRRVAGWLLHKARVEQSLVLKNSITRETLAGLLGLSRESLCRQLGRLAHEGVIDLKRKSIAILDEKALRRCLEE